MAYMTVTLSREVPLEAKPFKSSAMSLSLMGGVRKCPVFSGMTSVMQEFAGQMMSDRHAF